MLEIAKDCLILALEIGFFSVIIGVSAGVGAGLAWRYFMKLKWKTTI